MNDLTPQNPENSPQGAPDLWDAAIIGAGVAGLGAARALQAVGWRVLVLDKGRAPGGRVCTRQNDGCTFEHGAQNIKAGTSAFSRAAQELPRDLIRSFSLPVRLHDNGAVLPPDEKTDSSNREEKWAARGGFENLMRELARPLQVWTNTRVSHLEEADGEFTLRGESAALCRARHIVVTAPAPQSADLLDASILREPVAARSHALRAVAYNRCLSVLLRYNASINADWYALLAKDRAHPMLWLARENAKGYALTPGAALVAQLGPQISTELYDQSDDEIARRTIELVREVAPEMRALDAPIWTDVKRWRFSQAQNSANWHDANPAGARVLIAGDALCAKSRVELAYESGLRAARQLLAKIDDAR